MTSVGEHVEDDRWFAPRREDLLPSEEPVRLLDAQGRVRENPRYALDLEDDGLRALYRFMVITRKVDDEALKLGRQGQLAVYTSSLGQEAAQVGSAYALTERDWIFPSYREHGAARVRGVDPVQQLHHNRGTWVCAHDPLEYRFAPQTVSIATHLPHAAGLASAARLAGDDLVVIAYFGDGATSEGDAHEAMNLASVRRAPCVFFCQNNGWAISVPVRDQLAGPSIAHRAIGYGMPGIRVDGNDVLACYAVTRWAVDRARRGEGPTLIEALTYRMEAHSGSDDPGRYRPPGEIEAWAELDPLTRFRRLLDARGLWDAAMDGEVNRQADALAAELRAGIYDAPAGDPLELFDHVYVERPSLLQAQREMMRRELAGGEA
ncbi:pyruvate dehydrogenase (acetyl-transferring) E1 component subunit alpha [Pseudonocardia eucalypti]|uniref:Pyruvate dehydrogenase (Acetyl-transferring) E1 component subunit alpha n=1 Tax=Pseudonocardia eucalypti TaxID=648755 RepID=A0ABP9PR39_9PSEU|nr:pyruvate dehydrogenase E1 component alpha subunit [Pseudonocardia eucalypti]